MLRLYSKVASLWGLSHVELGNATWLIGGTFARLALAAVVDIAVARHLEPEAFGQLRFSIAIMILFSSLHGFSLGGLATRTIVSEPGNRDEIVGTVIMMRLVVALAIVPAAALTAWAARPGDTDVLVMTLILAGFATFGVFDSIDYVLQSELKGKYSIVVRLINLLVTFGVKIALIVLEAPLWTFAVAYGLDFFMAMLTFSAAYLRLRYSPFHLRFSLRRARQMFSVVWPAFFAGAAGALSLQVDQVMLGAMREAEDVGIYAAAARFTLIWFFVPQAIAQSAFPALVRARESDSGEYNSRLQRIYSGLAWTGIGIAAVLTLISGILITTLYGADFQDAGPVLAIQAWASPFIFMGFLFGRWLVAESRFLLIAMRHVLGASVNVIANLLLIPEHGASGAAVASLLSYAAAVYLASFIHPSTREAGRMMTRAVLMGPLNLLLLLRRRSA